AHLQTHSFHLNGSSDQRIMNSWNQSGKSLRNIYGYVNPPEPLTVHGAVGRVLGLTAVTFSVVSVYRGSCCILSSVTANCWQTSCLRSAWSPSFWTRCCRTSTLVCLCVP
ncbi:hypothetical protein XENOCAPTIV_003181, partial [Xenoophorus captivus]